MSMMQNQPKTDGSGTSGRHWFGFLNLLILSSLALYFACDLMRIGFSDADNPLWFKAISATFSLLVLVAMAVLAAVLVRRKIGTGSFLASSEEIRSSRARFEAKVGAGKPFWPQAGYWLLPAFFIAIFLVADVGIVLLAVNFLGCDWKLTATFGFIGLCLLSLPGYVVFTFIRRKARTGSFLPSQEEMKANRAKCAQPKPLRTRILLAICYLLPAVLFTCSALSHAHTTGSPLHRWILAVIWWWIAGVWIWQVFRPASVCRPDPALSISPDAVKNESNLLDSAS
jgi:hypothetical protein